MIGRHHARLLQASDRISFAGAVDPGGDRYRAVHDRTLVFDSVAARLARGLLEADTLTGNLCFYENGEIGVIWSAAQQFRRVSEGDVTRYALRREEPLKIEDVASST